MPDQVPPLRTGDIAIDLDTIVELPGARILMPYAKAVPLLELLQSAEFVEYEWSSKAYKINSHKPTQVTLKLLPVSERAKLALDSD